MGKRIDRLFRLLTQRRRQFGLGLEAQQITVNSYAAATGVEVIASYREIESSRKSDGPDLTKASRHLSLHAMLVIAKLELGSGQRSVHRKSYGSRDRVRRMRYALDLKLLRDELGADLEELAKEGEHWTEDQAVAEALKI